jgi:hypothetical protein
VASSVTPNSGIHCAWQRIATGKSRFVKFRYREVLYDARRIVIGRARVPLRRMDPDVLAELAYQLEDVFGQGWMN